MMRALRSKLTFVDLAGSERVSGQRAGELGVAHRKEMASINTSLSALATCIGALTQRSRRHVPYRDSVLTRLLQTSLGGNSRTLLLAAISPAAAAIDESISTLRFAHRAKQVALKATPNASDAAYSLAQQRQRRVSHSEATGRGAFLRGALASRPRVDPLSPTSPSAKPLSAEDTEGMSPAALRQLNVLSEENAELRRMVASHEEEMATERKAHRRLQDALQKALAGQRDIADVLREAMDGRDDGGGGYGADESAAFTRDMLSGRHPAARGRRRRECAAAAAAIAATRRSTLPFTSWSSKSISSRRFGRRRRRFNGSSPPPSRGRGGAAAAAARCGRRGESRTHVTIRWPLGVRFPSGKSPAATRAAAAAARKADVGARRRRRATRRVAAHHGIRHVVPDGRQPRAAGARGGDGSEQRERLRWPTRARARTTLAPTPTLGTTSPSTTPTRGGTRAEVAGHPSRAAPVRARRMPRALARRRRRRGGRRRRRAGGRPARQTRERYRGRRMTARGPRRRPCRRRRRAAAARAVATRAAVVGGAPPSSRHGGWRTLRRARRCSIASEVSTRRMLAAYTSCLGRRRRVAASRSCSRC